jgi:hypothetical protein
MSVCHILSRVLYYLKMEGIVNIGVPSFLSKPANSITIVNRFLSNPFCSEIFKSSFSSNS